MDSQKYGKDIPSSYINRLLKESSLNNFKISQQYKREFAAQIEIFIHYLVTFAEEISLEKGSRVISD